MPDRAADPDPDAPLHRATAGERTPTGEVDLAVVTMTFETSDAAAFAAVVSRYVVLARQEPGCRNVDLCTSAVSPGRVLVVSKWATPADQLRHAEGSVLSDFARDCAGILAGPPTIEVWDAPSAHDLR